MVFLTLSSLAWVAVIVLQAFLHFVIGPRYTSIEDECEIRNLDEAEQTNDTNAPLSKTINVMSKNEMTDDTTDQSTAVEGLETMGSFKSKNSEETAQTATIYPDERDSLDDSIRQTELRASRTQPPPPIGTDENYSFDCSFKSLPDNLLSSSTTSKNHTVDEGNDRQQVEYEAGYESDVTEDDCIDDEDDEEWRYQLIKDYYATSSHSSSNVLLRSISDEVNEDEDPALQPVCTINTLCEKLNQQRSLAELQLAAQERSRSVAFDHAPLSVIASY